MPLTLLVPDLLAPSDAPAEMRGMRLAALEKWLARAEVVKGPGETGMQWLARAWALPSPPPYAALALAGEGRAVALADEGRAVALSDEDRASAPAGAALGTNGASAEAASTGSWLRADPVHLRVDGDHLALHDACVLDVTEEEAREIVATLDELFREFGFVFHQAAPDRWYVRVPQGEAPVTTPLERAVGRDVFGMLPQGAGRINWRSAITEAQMVLSGHAVNEAREKAGRRPINSVWFWGEGPLPPRLDRVFSRIAANDSLARGLARLAGSVLEPLPGRLADLAAGGSVLAVIDALTPMFRANDCDAWRAQALEIDANWFAPLGEAIARFESVRIVLPGESMTLTATLGPAARWRWFRRRAPLASHA